MSKNPEPRQKTLSGGSDAPAFSPRGGSKTQDVDLSWYLQAFGRLPPIEAENRPPLITLKQIKDQVIEILSEKPRFLNTQFGARLVIDIAMGGKIYTLVINRVGFATELARLMREHKRLDGLKVKVEELEKRGKFIPYRLSVIT